MKQRAGYKGSWGRTGESCKRRDSECHCQQNDGGCTRLQISSRELRQTYLAIETYCDSTHVTMTLLSKQARGSPGNYQWTAVESVKHEPTSRTASVGEKRLIPRPDNPLPLHSYKALVAAGDAREVEGHDTQACTPTFGCHYRQQLAQYSLVKRAYQALACAPCCQFQGSVFHGQGP